MTAMRNREAPRETSCQLGKDRVVNWDRFYESFRRSSCQIIVNWDFTTFSHFCAKSDGKSNPSDKITARGPRSATFHGMTGSIRMNPWLPRWPRQGQMLLPSSPREPEATQFPRARADVNPPPRAKAEVNLLGPKGQGRG